MTARAGDIRVLLVEDNPGDAFLVQEALAELQLPRFEVDWVQTLAEAAAVTHPPEVVLLDLSLPDSTGTATVRSMLQLRGDVPVVVLTGLDDTGAALEALRAGAQDYLMKDEMSPRRLVQTITYALERHRLTHELERRTRELAESEARTAAVVDQLTDGLVVVDEDARIVLANRAAADLLNRAVDELVGERFELMPDGREEAPVPLVTATGAAVVAEIRASPILWQGRPAQVVSIRDVTALLETEELRHRQQRLESVGRLAGGVAHGLNNVMQSIATAGSLGVSQVSSGRDPAAVVDRLLATIEREVGRGAKLTHQLLIFAGRHVDRPVVLDLVAELVRLHPPLQASVDAGVELVLDVPRDPAPVTIDTTALELLLENLVRNAAEAMPGGGRISLVARSAGEEGFTVEVRDRGQGIDPADLDRVFEPFYSTKGSDGARGLGLSVAHGIVGQAGGRIRIDSAPGEGTVVTVWLPAAPQNGVFDLQADAGHDAGSAAPVVVVEDEEAAREGLVDLLQQLGFAAVGAESGEAGLELVEGVGCRLLLTDHALPGITGEELVRRLRERDPQLPVVMMSGYPPPEALGGEVEDGTIRFLQKPFRAAALRAAITDSLARAPATDGD